MPAAFPDDLPQPILFHQLKHHLQYQQVFIRSSAQLPEADIKAALQTIGSSQLDLYLGQLPPQQIAQEVLQQLQAQHLLSPDAYQQYLNNSSTDFRTLTLSDGTEWILRWGTAADRYVHLHPGRYAQHTVRVKANSLKTAMATAIALQSTTQQQADLALVNQARGQWLGLSPIKELEAAAGIQTILALLLN